MSRTRERFATVSCADFAGIAASVTCAIHCAAMPLVIGYLPLMGLDWLACASFHQGMAVLCFVLAALAFVPGWRTHRNLVPAAIGLAGVTLLSVAAYGESETCCTTGTPQVQIAPAAIAGESSICRHCCESAPAPETSPAKTASVAGWISPLMTPLGGILLVLGHLINHLRSCRCRDDGCCLSPDPGQRVD